MTPSSVTSLQVSPAAERSKVLPAPVVAIDHTDRVAHPRMYDADDPLLARIREIALAFPGTDEKDSHGRPAFFTRKVFAYYSGSIKVDDVWVQHEQAIMFLPDPAERPALEADVRFWVPGYLGPSGWLGLDVKADSDFVEVAELLEDSYRITTPDHLVNELDAGRLRSGS